MFVANSYKLLRELFPPLLEKLVIEAVEVSLLLLTLFSLRHGLTVQDLVYVPRNFKEQFTLAMLHLPFMNEEVRADGENLTKL